MYCRIIVSVKQLYGVDGGGVITLTKSYWNVVYETYYVCSFHPNDTAVLYSEQNLVLFPVVNSIGIK
jgi:hypothetical protein